MLGVNEVGDTDIERQWELIKETEIYIEQGWPRVYLF